MKKKLFLLILAILSISSTKAQEIYSIDAVGQKSYDLFMAKKWNELIDYAKESNKHGIDFYYLQYRMGIAYYELKKYRKAIPYFKKVVEQTPNDEVAQEYLYYSYLFSGRKLDAKTLSETFSDVLLERIKINKSQVFESISIHAGYEQSDASSTSILGNKLLNYQLFGSIGLNISSSASSELDVSFSNLLLNYNLNYPNAQNVIETQQNELHIGLNQYISKGFNLHFATTLILTNADQVLPTTQQQKSSKNNSNEFNFIVSTGLSVDVGLFKFLVNENFLHLNSLNRLQTNLQMIFYPFSNLNLYSITELNHFYDLKQKNNNLSDDLYFKQTLGFKLTQFCWLEGFYTSGKQANFVENNGIAVFNDIYSITDRFGASLILLIKKFTFTIKYQYLKKETNSLYNSDIKLYKDYSFSNQSITGGIKWNF